MVSASSLWLSTGLGKELMEVGSESGRELFMVRCSNQVD